LTPDPNILGAKTVQALMTVLNAPPYNLDVPVLADLPKDSTLVALWKSAITVTAGEYGCSYYALATGPWQLMLNLEITVPAFCLAGFDAKVSRRARPAARRPPRQRRERSKR
jgi:hypothetical protein